MRLTMHLLKADIRRLFPHILAWVGVTGVATLLLGVDHIVARDGLSEELFELAAAVLWLGRLALGATLAALIVQTYPLVGSTAFWMTRPFPPGALLASRLLLLTALLVVVPAICDAVLMACYRVRPADAAAVLLESSLGRAVWMMALMAAAAWTRTFVRFVLLCGAAMVGAAVLLNVALMMALSSGRPAGVILTVSSEIATELSSRVADQTATVLAWMVLLVTGSLLLRVQYRTRSRRRSVLIGMTGWVAACLAAVAWPWPMLEADEPSPASLAAASGVSLDVLPETMVFDRSGVRFDDRDRVRMAWVRAYLTGTPPGWTAVIRLVHADLEVDGRRISSGRFTGGVTLPGEPASPDRTQAAVQEALGAEVFGKSTLFANASLPILRLPESEIPAPGTAATYRGEFEIDLLKVEQAAVLPLARGASFQDGSFRLVVDDMLMSEGGLRLRVRISEARSVFGRQPVPGYWYYLRNSQTREALPGELLRQILKGPGYSRVITPFGFLGTAYGFRSGSAYTQFPSTESLQLPSTVAPGPNDHRAEEAWLNAAELVVIRTTRAGSVRRSLVMPLKMGGI